MFTEGLFVLGERDEPAGWHDLVVEARATGAVATSYIDGRLLERVAGIAATAAEKWDAAEAHFLQALRQGDELPHQVERLETRRFYAQMLGERAGPGDMAEPGRSSMRLSRDTPPFACLAIEIWLRPPLPPSAVEGLSRAPGCARAA